MTSGKCILWASELIVSQVLPGNEERKKKVFSPNSNFLFYLVFWFCLPSGVSSNCVYLTVF